MKPEQLKVIAEGMGYVIFSIHPEGKSITVWDGVNIYTRKRYKPHTTNKNQMVEIMEKLKISIQPLVNPNAWQAGIDPHSMLGHSPALFKESKTINEAVCNAAYEYFSKDKS